MRHFLITISVILFSLVQASFSFAQTTQNTSVPSSSAIEASIADLEDNSELSEEQIQTATDLYKEALQRLRDIALAQEQETQYQSDLTNSAAVLRGLNEEIELAKEQLDTPPLTEMELGEEPMREEDLLELEQELASRESELRGLRSEIDGYRASLQALSTRQVNAPKELIEVRAELGTITSGLADLGEVETASDVLGRARRVNLRVKAKYRRQQIATLEREVASLPRRNEIINARQMLAELQSRELSREVQVLQERTGQRRLNEALQFQSTVLAEADRYSDLHPVLSKMAERNKELAKQVIGLAASEAAISRNTASARSRQDDVLEDLEVARDLANLESLDRDAGATLRRLGNQLVSPQAIRADLNETQTLLVNATRQRLVAQEALRDLPVGRVNPETVLNAARRINPTLPAFNSEEIAALQILNDSQRSLLLRISTEGTDRVTDIRQLQAAQEKLLETTQDLQSLLDEKLLWIPSVPAIGVSWLPKIVNGSLELFAPEHIVLVFETLTSQLQKYWPLAFIFGVVIIGLYRTRPWLYANIQKRSTEVGRVKVDSAWHTPAVLVAGCLIALPLPLLFLLSGILFDLVDLADPVVDGVENACYFLAIFLFIVLTWRVWDRDKSLFGTHFKMAAIVRQTVNKQLRWFVPVVGVTSGLLALTTDMTSAGIYEGLSLLLFILTCLVLGVFGFKITLLEKNKFSNTSNDPGWFVRYNGLISVFIIGIPIGAAALAAAGYYETADELLWRFFMSALLLFLTYLVWGTIRRVIVVAQRQLRYRQAVERRDAAIKARREKEEAEERGEEMSPPPKVDTKEIDVSSLTRQSAQLLNTLIIIAFAVLMWANWSSLLPALSIFDGIDVWTYKTGELDELNNPIETAVTLWNVLQSLVILGLTFIAARNLPGFLEIFVLNRLGVDPGTRYAVVTILGYIIIALGLIVGVNRLGLQWSQLKFVAAGLSVGIGFGLQKIIANFVSGLVILFERPIRIGDYVTIGEESGFVSRIKIRATTLNDLDHREILIPNEALISERVTNWTLSNSVTRLIVKVGIAYGSNTDKARELMLDTVKKLPKVLDTPPPSVLFMGFGDSSLDFEVRVFLRTFDERVPMTHTIHTEINKTLEKAGIPIPFPQRDLNIVTQNVPLEFLQKSKSAQSQAKKASTSKAKGKTGKAAKTAPKSKSALKPKTKTATSSKSKTGSSPKSET
ncbi:mechanosensitive ion channel domain-containing protein [Litorimonas haliclonae]|uniref:mechanosensitive ion channel domain-containing protein n=1 Tax=Litorimonas haliclonae TaxID=2081977 RepID=UPI0039EFAC4A